MYTKTLDLGAFLYTIILLTATLKWAEEKRLANLKKHGVDFAIAARFDWVAIGWIDRTLYVLVYVIIDDLTVRIISLRKATRQEKKRYEQSI